MESGRQLHFDFGAAALARLLHFCSLCSRLTSVSSETSFLSRNFEESSDSTLMRHWRYASLGFEVFHAAI